MTDLRISKLQVEYPPDDPETPVFGLDFSSRGPVYPVLKKVVFFGENFLPDRIEHCDKDGLIVIREDYFWEINEAKTEVISRTRSITWVDETGHDHPKKKWVEKVYEVGPGAEADRKKHLIRRRKRVIQEIERQVLSFLTVIMPTQALQGSAAFKTRLMPLINLYVEDNSNYLRDAVDEANAPEEAFLDLEISEDLSLRTHIHNLLTWI